MSFRRICLGVLTLVISLMARSTSAQLVKALDGVATQVQRINLLKDSDFIFDFLRPAALSTIGPDGHMAAANASSMPALLAEDVSLTVATIGPCGLNTPHTHPRATEFNYVLNGSFTTGMIQENGARTILGVVKEGQASLFPRGSIHFEANLECVPATFIAAFSNPDPGVLQVAQGLFGLPASIVGATLGGHLNGNQLAILRTMIPHNVAFGLDECIHRCGLKPVVGTTITTSTLKHLLHHSHLTGYAYGVFIITLVVLWTMIHQFRKTAMGDAFRMSPRMRRYVTYAPTITIRKGIKGKRDPITIELPSNLRSGMCLVFWLANIGLACWDLPDEKPPRELFQRVGWLAIWNMIGLVILAMKTSPLPWLLGRSHDGLVLYHKIMAITAFVEVWIHSIWGMYVIPATNPAHHFYWHKAQTGAWISTPAFTIIVLTAWSSWFVRTHFETFLATHVLGLVVLLVGLWLHNPLLKWYVVAVIAIWSFDRVIRLLRVVWLNRNARTELATLTDMDGAVKIRFESKTYWRPGSHIYINFPGCDPLQSHPYTIASVAKKGEQRSEIQLLVQGSGGHGFSEKIRARVSANGGMMNCRFIFHGPYGAAPNMKYYQRVLCIGGGSGITLPIAMTQAFLSVPDVDNRGKVDLLWCAKAFSDFKRFDLLAIRAAGANIYLYETRPPKSTGIMPTLLRATTALIQGSSDSDSSDGSDASQSGRTRGIITGGEDIEVCEAIPGSASLNEKMGTTVPSSAESGKDVRPKLTEITTSWNSGMSMSSPRLGEVMVAKTLAYEGTRYSQQSAPGMIVSPADTMPSFIASDENRMLHRQATIAEIQSPTRRMTEVEAQEAANSLGMDLSTARNGASTLTTPGQIRSENLREVFAPIGAGRPNYQQILDSFVARAQPQDRLCVVVCGNKGICRSVRNAIALCPAVQRIDLHVEEF